MSEQSPPLFDATLVLNLDRSIDRWSAVQDKWWVRDGVGGSGPAQRFVATDGWKESNGNPLVFVERGVLTPDAMFLVPGCTLVKQCARAGLCDTTRRAWQRIVDEQWQWTLILEDDAELHPALQDNDYLRYLMTVAVPDDCHLVYVGCQLGVGNYLRDRRHRPGDVFPDFLERLNSHVCRVKQNVFGMYAYAVSLEGAKMLLAHAVPFPSVIDRLPAIPAFRRYAICPSTVLGDWDAADTLITDGKRCFLGLASVRPCESTLHNPSVVNATSVFDRKALALLENCRQRPCDAAAFEELAFYLHLAFDRSEWRGLSAHVFQLAYTLEVERGERADPNRCRRLLDRISILAYECKRHLLSKQATKTLLCNYEWSPRERARLEKNLAFAERGLAAARGSDNSNGDGGDGDDKHVGAT